MELTYELSQRLRSGRMGKVEPWFAYEPSLEFALFDWWPEMLRAGMDIEVVNEARRPWRAWRRDNCAVATWMKQRVPSDV